MGIRIAAHSSTDDILSPRDIMIAKALMLLHGATVVFGLAAGGRFLILAAFGAVMATAIGYIVFREPRSHHATPLRKPQLEP